MGVHDPSGFKLRTHEYVTACFGNDSLRMAGYPSWIVTQALGKYKICCDWQKLGLGGLTYVGLDRSQFAGRVVGARVPSRSQNNNRKWVKSFCFF